MNEDKGKITVINREDPGDVRAKLNPNAPSLEELEDEEIAGIKVEKYNKK